MEKSEKQMIEQLKTYIPEERKAELGEILAYGEKIKLEGEKKKNEFWSNHDRDDFMKLLKYKRKHKEELENKYEYLEGMKGVEREVFVDEYLHDDIVYSGEVYEGGEEKQRKTYYYDDWKNWKVVNESWVVLDLGDDEIGSEGAKTISEMELKEGVVLSLNDGKIGVEGAKAIAKNLKLKDGGGLYLRYNEIGDEGAKAIAKNLKLKDGVELALGGNEIGDDGAEAIAENLKLKDGVYLVLRQNYISNKGARIIMENMKLRQGVVLDLTDNEIKDEMKQKLKEWEKSYHDSGINCKVLVD